jgi:hypothetical protein
LEKAEDEESFISWSFRERNPTNISPKVKAEAVYEIHYGLRNALNTGKPLRRSRGRGKAEKPRQERDQRVGVIPRDGGRVRRVRYRGEVAYVSHDTRTVVIRLERTRKRVRAPAAVLGGPGESLVTKWSSVDLLCVERDRGGVSISEMRIEGYVWSAEAGSWKSASAKCGEERNDQITTSATDVGCDAPSQEGAFGD